MRSTGKIAGLAVLAALTVSSLAPAAFGSTLSVDLNPGTKVANLTSVSSTDLVLTYPANSTLSNYLAGYDSSSSLSGNFGGNSQAVANFHDQFHDHDNSQISISNMTVSYNYSAKANSTALVVNKMTEIIASVAGIFNVTNGTVTANLGWRSFYIVGALNLDLQDHIVDVNLAGPSLAESINGRSMGVEILTGMFAGNSLWSRPTLNFSSLSSPLSTWTKNYNSGTNTTTFSKTIAGNSTFSTRYTDNGQTYSLSMTSDPSAVISTNGYAKASGDSLTITKAPTLLNPLLWVGVAAIVFGVIAVGAVYFARRSGATASGVGPVASKQSLFRT
ncbi:MAG TPA: hypothetical protein VLX56_06425 [Nitrososphaerales archaeon]|nr:hypothetical protein [Nitrososphaerales archaeon]